VAAERGRVLQHHPAAQPTAAASQQLLAVDSRACLLVVVWQQTSWRPLLHHSLRMLTLQPQLQQGVVRLLPQPLSLPPQPRRQQQALTQGAPVQQQQAAASPAAGQPLLAARTMPGGCG
jgi:hypothetical protein